jgi:hypothetical protein
VSALGEAQRVVFPFMFLLCAHLFTIAALPQPSVEHCIMFNDLIEITLPEERRNNSNFLNVIEALTGEGFETAGDAQGQKLLILKS